MMRLLRIELVRKCFDIEGSIMQQTRPSPSLMATTAIKICTATIWPFRRPVCPHFSNNPIHISIARVSLETLEPTLQGLNKLKLQLHQPLVQTVQSWTRLAL
eukprot:gb/GFBE01001252.1/.p1 GENE.gb/GFBE01001252.1/~~gb/GFBE01001252.1/.p1  ORF type:complete len:102 (+),score=8.84 gb/GFBE01001252.1/:1-306(+)